MARKRPTSVKTPVIGTTQWDDRFLAITSYS